MRARALALTMPALFVLLTQSSALAQTMIIRTGLSEVSGMVSMGVDPPPDVQARINAAPPCATPDQPNCRENIGVSAFQVEVRIPLGVAETLAEVGKQLSLIIESERVAGAVVAQSTAPFVRYHLRTRLPDGSADPRPVVIPLRNALAGMPPDWVATQRYQDGANRFYSPWIVVIADPRASIHYLWPAGADKRAAGCFNCERPLFLRGKTEADGVFEVFSAGRFLNVRLDPSSVEGTRYGYLGTPGRLEARLSTVLGDTVRNPDTLVAAQNPPVADGMLQEATYLHSGELSSGAIDLDAGGRAGWDVLAARSYRSRTLGSSPLGQGWDSAMFQRLRLLPSGEVEYRDGAEVWTFKPPGSGSSTYESPKGLFLKLTKAESGWKLLDQQWRVSEFDALGRLTVEHDEFYDGVDTSKGNSVRYVYDAQGRLGTMIDPLGRQTQLRYWEERDATDGASADLVREIEDWRGRSVRYEYSSRGTLRAVLLPEVKAPEGVPASFSFEGARRPRMEYSYATPPLPAAGGGASQAFNDAIEFSGNLLSIKEPEQVAAGSGVARVEFSYDPTTDALKRDRVLSQRWPCASFTTFCAAATARFDYPSSTAAETVDIFGQRRTYVLTSRAPSLEPRTSNEGIHVRSKTLAAVPVFERAETALPASISPMEEPVVKMLTTEVLEFDSHGQHLQVRQPNGLILKSEYAPAPGGAPGLILMKITETPPSSGRAIVTELGYGVEPLRVATLEKIRRAYEGDAPIERDTPSPSREKRTVERTDDGVRRVSEYNAAGELTKIERRTMAGEPTITASLSYYDTPLTDPFQAGRLKKVERAGVNDIMEYAAAAGGGLIETTTSVERGVKHVTEHDAWERVVRQEVIEGSGVVLRKERFGYNADGNLAYHVREQSGVGTVETFLSYDPQQRIREARQTKASVLGTETELRTRRIYEEAGRTITTVEPFAAAEGPRTVMTLDALGRVAQNERRSADGALSEGASRLAYDIHGGLAYQSDTKRTAAVMQHDSFGREIASLRTDGVQSSMRWDAWDQPVESSRRGSSAESSAALAHTKTSYSKDGRLRKIAQELESGGLTRVTKFTWDDGERHVTARVGEVALIDSEFALGAVRVNVTEHDSAGRVVREEIGQSNGLDHIFALSPDESYRELRHESFLGDLPTVQKILEKRAGAMYQSVSSFDGLDRLVGRTEAETYTSEARFDEASNVIASKAPGMNEARTLFDARGLPIRLTLPDGQSIEQQFDELGNLRLYRDEAGQQTRYVTDALGRVVRVDYPDSTSEEMRYEAVTGLVSATRDRAGRWLSYVYDNGGRVDQVHEGENPTVAPLFADYSYDSAGRLAEARNKDSAIQYDSYDLLGRPRVTRAVRYKDASGLATRTVLDTHTQGHAWSVFSGERQRWRMPVAGPSLPTSESDSPWRVWIDERRDGGGNLVRQSEELSASAAASGGIVSEAQGRGVGRIASRRIQGLGAASWELVTRFGYADGVAGPAVIGPLPPSAPGPVSGLMGRMETTLFSPELPAPSSRPLTGTVITRDNAKRTQTAEPLANPARLTSFSYDLRGRLRFSRMGELASASPPIVNDGFTVADFKDRREVEGRLTPTQRAVLGTAALLIEPPSWVASELLAHRIERRTLLLGDDEAAVRDYTFDGGRRSSDGVWSYSYDAAGRLVSKSSVIEGRRIDYLHDPNDRPIARTAYRLSGADTWVLEDRTNVLARDGLPAADVTMVWDPTVDRLVAIFAAGASVSPAPSSEPPAPTSGLLRQYLHGDQDVDDPIEVLVTPSSQLPAPSPVRYLPVIDQVSGGSLTAVLDQSGKLVERVLYADAYGDAPRYLHGPVVDRISVSSTATTRTIQVHISEPIDETTVASGARLSALDASGTLLRTSAVTPSLVPRSSPLAPQEIQWTLTTARWATLREGAASIEIAITPTLRSSLWSDGSVQPPPSFVTTLYAADSTTDLRFRKRESIDSLESMFAASGERTIYEIADLYLIASTESKTKLLFDFHALPFREPADGTLLARARWYDPATANFLTPDPLGSIDSSNLYLFAGGDPVNGRDPEGMQKARPMLRNAPKESERPLRPGQRPRKPPRLQGPPKAPYADLPQGSFERFQAAVQWVNSQPRSRGAIALGFRTANELTPREQREFLEHRRRLHQDPAYRAQWQGLVAGSIELQAELSPVPLPALGGAGGDDGGYDETVLTPWGTRSLSTGKFVVGPRSGGDPVEDFIAQAEANGFQVLGREISFKTPFETRRVDVVLRNRATGHIGGIEIKSSRAEFHKLRKEQFASDRYINQYGATAVGKNAGRAEIERIDSVMKVLWEP